MSKMVFVPKCLGLGRLTRNLVHHKPFRVGQGILRIAVRTGDVMYGGRVMGWS